MAQQLLPGSRLLNSASTFRNVARPRKLAAAGRRQMTLRAESKVTREYREDDDKIVVPGQEQKPQDLYAQQAKMAKKSGMSKEYKDRLRQEYVGFGGSENQMLSRRGHMVMVATVVEEKEAATATAPTTSGSSSKWVIDENENLKSTWEHRAWTYGCITMLAATFWQGCSQVSNPTDAVAAIAAVLGAYALSDLGTGFYHWGVDNYGDGQTPLVGRQIAAFQGHHQRPWTITMREFCNNVHQVFKPATAPAAVLLAASLHMPAAWNMWSSTFLFLVCMSQQAHAWSHTKKSELPAIVVALQDAGVLISRKAHGAHHRSPFDCNYCIVSGMWNPLLDNSGVFPALERWIHSLTGVEPRSWAPPLADWQERERPQGL